MGDQDTPGGRADKRARIIAGQALREAAAPPPTGRRGGRRRNHGPIWTTPAPIVVTPPAEGDGAGDGLVAASAEVASHDKTPPAAGPSRGTPAVKNWRS